MNTISFSESNYSDVQTEISDLQRRILESGGGYLPDKDQAGMLLVARDGKKTVGCAYWLDRGQHVDVAYMVDPEYQHQGIATHLLHQVEAKAKLQHKTAVHAFVKESDRVKSFFEQQGYTQMKKDSNSLLFVKKFENNRQ